MAKIARSKAFVLAKRTIQEFMDDKCMNLAASIAYYGFLSLFPLILFVIAVFGQMLQDPAFQERILAQTGTFLPGAENFVRETIEGVVKARGAIGALSVLTLLWSASGVFGATAQAIDDAWEIKQSRPFISQSLMNIGLAIGAGIFLLISLVLTGSFQLFAVIAAPLIRLFPFNSFWVFMGIFVPLLSTLMIFLLIYKVFPNTKVAWKEALVGAGVAAVLFEILKNLFGWYTANLANYNAVYGSVGTVVVLLTWAYFSAAILLLGAELSSVYAAYRRSAATAPEGAYFEERPQVAAGRKPSPVIAAVVAAATAGLIAVRSLASLRAGWTDIKKGLSKTSKRG